MIETVNATVELAARNGLTQVRIALEPAELGEIRIHLTQTSSGLLARVTASTPAAAQALAAGHLELRQSLSDAGVSLARLHIGHGEQSAASGGEAPAGGRDGTGAGGRAQARLRSDGSGSPVESEADEAAAKAQVQDADRGATGIEGGLIDVLV
jgi:flagellar hook-length control protein FliK